VTAIKIDPYLNIDAGTMSPFEHGEVYVLEDGGEVDLDLGNYERFLDLTLTQSHSITSGKIFEQVIKRERTGHYLGKTVQMVPHVTDAIQDWILDVARRPVDRSGLRPQVCLIELGGTVGDLEIQVYLEALQQFMFKVGNENFIMAHVGMVPVMGATGEQKTKPCQHSVKLLREAGLKPDILLCRSEQHLEEPTRKKLSLFCQVPAECVISLHDISNIYRVPLLLAEQQLGQQICRRFGLPNEATIAAVLSLDEQVAAAVLGPTMLQERLLDFNMLADRADACMDEVIVAIVGKYTGLHDSYISVIKALKHASTEAGLHLSIEWVESGDLEPNVQQLDHKRFDAAWWRLKNTHGVLVPGGFGDRGIEGKVLAANYCRSSNTPYLGISVGLQTAVIEFARSELGWENANSTEFDEATPHPVVVFMPEASATVLGGTMRLGTRNTVIKDPESLACKVYGGKTTIAERFRNRYEVNTACVAALEARGMRFTGQDERGQRMQIAELRGHPFYFSTQFHPEFQSRPSAPAPPFLGFVLASAKRLDRRLEEDGKVLRAGAGFERKI
jgi:CTP synthase